MLKITSVKKTKDGLRVDWSIDVQPNAMSIVFDDEGSCTNVGLDVGSLSFTAKTLSAHRTYEIYLKALVDGGWVTSESQVYRLV